MLVDNATVNACRILTISCTEASSQFLKQLEALFESSRGSHSIWLNHKRCAVHLVLRVGSELNKSYPVVYGADAVPLDDTTEYPCLIRAMDGKKTKFSTRVGPSFSSHLQSSHL
jgi:hypothetical protein